MDPRTPKVGEIVTFIPDANDTIAKLNDSFDPMPAIVTRVHGPDMVNLTIFPDTRPPQCRQSVGHISVYPDVSHFDFIESPEPEAKEETEGE